MTVAPKAPHAIRFFAVAFLLAIAPALLPQAAEAATFRVTKTADTADGVCDADCSLREAVIAANAAPDADTITLPPGVHRLSREGGDEDGALTGDLDIRAGVSITGSGARATTVEGGPVERVFHSPPQPAASFTANIGGMTITGGGDLSPDRPDGYTVSGGGVRNEARGATLNLGGVTIRRNNASHGGGVHNGGKMTIARSTISDHKVFLRASGGGIANDGDLTLLNSTVSRNYSGDGGGISHGRGTLTIRSSTIAFNESSEYLGSAAGISASAASRGISVRNSIVARNEFSDGYLSARERIANCWGKVTSRGHNLENGTTCGFTRSSDLRAYPRLGPLQDNGGPTPTRALLRGSPAIDAGGAPHPRVDQRGVSRPRGKASDIGAFERR